MAGENANYAKMYTFSTTTKVIVLNPKLKETFKMRRLLIAACAVVVSTPVFADQLFDTCYKLATDRVGPISQTVHGHFQKFVRECVRGKIPGVTAVSVRGGRSVDGGEPGSEEGRIKCVTGSNGQRYCY